VTALLVLTAEREKNPLPVTPSFGESIVFIWRIRSKLWKKVA
jgi:hypothetical protein